MNLSDEKVLVHLDSRIVDLKSELVKEWVEDRLQNKLVLKIDVAQQPVDTLLFWFMISEQVGRCKCRIEDFVWTRLERPFVQILVLKATIHV